MGTKWKSIMHDPLEAEPAPSWKWLADARCDTSSGLDWYSTSTRMISACKAVCETCPVIHDCLEAAMNEQDAWGIWGGLTVGERRELASQRGTAPPAGKGPHGTNARYAKHGCRCNGCRDAHTTYERERAARKANS